MMKSIRPIPESAVHREVPPDILASYEAYGCRVNAISPEELFRRYEQAGFLYPAKMGKLAPFLPLVKENWRKGLRGGELILYCVTHESSDREDWASGACWRTTKGGFQSQHLVSIGGPVSSRAVMLGTQAMRLQVGCEDENYQNWFRPENRFPARVFGTLGETIGPEHSSVATFNLFACPLNCGNTANSATIVTDAQNGRQSGLYELAEQTRGRVYAKAEELGIDDLLLDSVDQLYARVGLRRYRRVWLAMLPGHDLPVGAAIAYRGPLGFNFSFLENRCDLLLSPALTSDQVADVALTLLAAAASAYEDFEPGAIPLIADDRAAPVLQSAGCQFIRQYCQSIWLRDGFVPWYRHVEKFYDRIIRANKRHGLAAKHVSNSSSGTECSTASDQK